jgi:dienelactone hydrolase
MGKDIKLTASDNFQLGGYRADPAGAPKAAVVVIQEIFGVNHHIRSICDRLAVAGMSRSRRRSSIVSSPISNPAIRRMK